MRIIKQLFVSAQSAGIVYAFVEKIKTTKKKKNPSFSRGTARNMDFLFPNVAVSFLTTLSYYLQLTVYSTFSRPAPRAALNFVTLKDEFFSFPFRLLRKSESSSFPQCSAVICYENLDQERTGKRRTTLLQAISWENCLVRIIMHTEAGRKSGRQPGERDLNM